LEVAKPKRARWGYVPIKENLSFAYEKTKRAFEPHDEFIVRSMRLVASRVTVFASIFSKPKHQTGECSSVIAGRGYIDLFPSGEGRYSFK